MKRVMILAFVLCLTVVAEARPLTVLLPELCPTNDMITMEARYAPALRRAGHVPLVMPATTNREEVAAAIARADVVLLCGGADVEPQRYGEAKSPKCGKPNLRRDAFEWAVLDAALAQKKPVAGICRGEQLINAYFGGTLYQNVPSELPGAVKHASLAKHEIRILPDSRLAKVLGVTNAVVNSWHHQGVKKVAPGFRAVAWTPDGLVEAIESVDRPIVGVQFHPEIMSNEGDERAAEQLRRILDWAGATAAASSGERPFERPSEVIFCFDTEDFTCKRNADGIVTLAKICEDEGIKGHFMVVGYLADQLEKWGRQDAIDAIRRHYIGFHTLRHTLHPNILEISDDEDWEVSYRKLAEMENEGIGILRRVFPGMTLWTSCPPGPSDSYIANRYYADQGFRMDLGASWLPDDLPDMWYCGLRRIPYTFSLEEFFPGGPWQDWDTPEQKKKLLDKLAGMRRFVIYAHPNRVHSNEYFDAINYNRVNSEWGKWQQPTPRDPAVVEAWIRRVHEFIGMLKADPRFRITTLPEILATEKPRVPITPDKLSAIRASLEKDFGPVREPANWSVAEVFVAVTHFLSGGKLYMPGDVGGFLEKPVGVSEACTVTRADVIRAAQALRIGRYLPTKIVIGDRTVGPADYLFAALEILTTDAETVTLRPREQLGSFKAFPKLEKCSRGGKWLYWPEYKDKYTCDRMRWQLWTFRYE